MSKNAVISDCQNFRYWLERRWIMNFDPMVFVMLNPSTADAELDDPTIRRCVSFAKREGASGLIVVNLFAYRATQPSDLVAASDPVGPLNFRYINEAFLMSAISQRPVVCAWGSHKMAKERVPNLFRRATDCDAKLVCLGTTADGSPRHPLYVRADKEFEPFTDPDTKG